MEAVMHRFDSEGGAMERHTFDNTMRAFRNRKPFQPFTVAMVNGDRLEIDHPEAFVARDGVAIFVAPGGAPVIFDFEGVSQVIGDLSGQGTP
jgi:hypothetical protein